MFVDLHVILIETVFLKEGFLEAWTTNEPICENLSFGCTTILWDGDLINSTACEEEWSSISVIWMWDKEWLVTRIG